MAKKLVINNVTAVTGDGKTQLENATIYVKGDCISGVEQKGEIPSDADEVLNAKGLVAFPGLINCHAHGITPGPIFPSGAPKLPEKLWKSNLRRHLLEGTTTVLSVCGFVLPDEVAEADDWCPINVKGGTTHNPKNLEAALTVDGTGLSRFHQEFTVQKALETGAVAIGEVGAGHTLGGGGQDYMYIPRAIEDETGVKLEPNQARALKYAVLGRHIDVEAYDERRTAQVLRRVGLGGKLSPTRAKELIHACVLPSFNVALEGFDESARLALEYGVPALFHNSAPSKEAMLRIGDRYARDGARLIACHSNHGTFEAEEAVQTARLLRQQGVVVEVCVLDGFIRKRLVESVSNWDRLFEEGLVDIIGTDYAGGDHDPMPAALQHVVDKGFTSLPEVVAMATSNTARVYQDLAPERGQLKRGFVADITLTHRSRLDDVQHVIVSGDVVVRAGTEVWSR